MIRLKTTLFSMKRLKHIYFTFGNFFIQQIYFVLLEINQKPFNNKKNINKINNKIKQKNLCLKTIFCYT